MAEQDDDSEKTEEPTAKKLQDARDKGDVPSSQEVSNLVILTTAAFVIMVLGGPISQYAATTLMGYLQNLGRTATDPGALMGLARDVTLALVLIVFVPFVLLTAASIIAHVAQTGFIFSGQKMKPDISKLSPVKGLGRMFGKPALANFLKGLGKLVLVASAGSLAVWPLRDQLLALVWVTAGAVLGAAQMAVVVFSVAALGVYALIAVVDYVATRHSWMQKQRMSRREQKQEHKSQEGDPIIKQRLRQIRMQRSRQRMMAAVPDATVVVTNPTHYAVALKYEDGSQAAPVCVAKGTDHLALKLREIAKAHDVPVVENPPLARALHASMEVNDPVPVEHFTAVAKLIGYVLKIARNRSQSRDNG